MLQRTPPRDRKDNKIEEHFFLNYLTRDLYLQYIKNYYSSMIKRQVAQFKNGQKI